MFSIDPALLPSLATRKALLVVDAQNDFLAEDGALPVQMPPDLPQRLSDLASNFRRNGGEIIWVQSQFESSRSLADEQILLDTSSPSNCPAPVRGSHSRNAPVGVGPARSPEAFLTLVAGKGRPCVIPGAPGTEMHPIVKEAVGPKDHVLVKTFYSAFKVDELLRLLRVRLVTELFICGSSTNIGVMATAIEAASHGYYITIVEDCCGSQSMSQHRTALRRITNTTGCKVLRAAEVLGAIKPQSTTPERTERFQATGGRSPTVRLHRGKKDAVAPPVSAILSSIERLSLSDKPAADDEHTPEILAQHKSQRQRPRPSSALQPLAGSGDPQSQTQADRDAVAATDTSPSAPNAPIPVTLRQPAARTPDEGRCGPVKSEEAVCPDPPTRGPRSFKKRCQQSPPPPKPVVELRPNANVHPHVNNGLNKPESIGSLECLTVTATASAGIHPSPREPKLAGSNTPSTISSKKNNTMASQDTNAAESEPLCEGDTKVIYNVLPEPLVHNIFERIRCEVNWQRMSHQGGEVPRLVAVQGQVNADGSKPIYRHPADESPPLLPFTPAVDEIRRVVEAKLQHPLNHVLIQFYRDGNDYISEHSDKTLDIDRDSFIANVSLGAERTMTLRTKRQPKDVGANLAKDESEPGSTSSDGRKRSIQRARLPHNSLFQMGLATNMRWMHAIRQDKRLAREKSAAELAYDGARISLTFRRIGTFLDSEDRKIWGQGATGKTKDEAREVINGQTAEAVSMLKAFGRENQSTEFDWDAHYGAGFDVLHITAAARLFLSADLVVNMRVQIMLAELGVGYARGSVADSTRVRFVDNDEGKTSVEGERDVMIYLLGKYGEGFGRNTSCAADRFEEGLALWDEWRGSSDWGVFTPWETALADEEFVSGSLIGVVDFAVWPVLYFAFGGVEGGEGVKGDENVSQSQSQKDEQEIEKGKGEDNREVDFPNLRSYYRRVRARESVARTLASGRY